MFRIAKRENEIPYRFPNLLPPLYPIPFETPKKTQATYTQIPNLLLHSLPCNNKTDIQTRNKATSKHIHKQALPQNGIDGE